MKESEIEYQAKRVWMTARRQPIVTTDDVTGSTALVGFFVPAMQMNALGRAVADFHFDDRGQRIDGFVVHESVGQPFDAPMEWPGLWVGVVIGIVFCICVYFFHGVIT